MKTLRTLALLIAVALLGHMWPHVPLHAQSYQVSLPARSPFLATYAFSSGGSGPPMLDTPQFGSLSMTSVSTITSGNLAVVNSNYVRLIYTGQQTNDAGNSPASGLCSLAEPNIIDGTHVTITASRGTADGNTTVCYYELYSLPPSRIHNIQNGSTNGTTTTITAVNLAKAELDYGGQVTVNTTNADTSIGRCQLTSSTGVTCGPSSVAVRWRVIEWN